MKAEHRHELQQNSMIRFFSRIKSKLTHAPNRKALVVGGIILAILAVVGVWLLVNNISASRSSRRTLAVLDMQPAEPEKGEFAEPDALWARARDEFIRDNGGTVQAYWVELQQARADYQFGLQKIFESFSRSEAQKRLTSAAESFEKLAKDLKATPILVGECLISAGRCHELLGDLDRAKGLYEKAAENKDFRGGDLAKQAQRLADRIESRREELMKLNAAIEKAAEPPPPPPIPPKKDDKPETDKKNDTPPKKDDKPDTDKKDKTSPKKDDKPETDKKDNTPPKKDDKPETDKKDKTPPKKDDKPETDKKDKTPPGPEKKNNTPP